MKKKYFNVFFLLVIMLAAALFSQKGIAVMKYLSENLNSDKDKKIVVIDAGHGGIDPGKVGINDALEKDINLSIAFKVKKILEDKNIEVIMTREDDKGLYEDTDRNKKSVDMRKRVEIINNAKPVCTVSIHQNSFQQESSKGAQVFYHKSSSEGKQLAEILQKQLKDYLQDGNKREAKSNESYYMLKNTSSPLVIVECGFLSNYEEAVLLLDEEYQKKLSEAICLGIIEYLENY